MAAVSGMSQNWNAKKYAKLIINRHNRPKIVAREETENKIAKPSVALFCMISFLLSNDLFFFFNIPNLFFFSHTWACVSLQPGRGYSKRIMVEVNMCHLLTVLFRFRGLIIQSRPLSTWISFRTVMSYYPHPEPGLGFVPRLRMISDSNLLHACRTKRWVRFCLCHEWNRLNTYGYFFFFFLFVLQIFPEDWWRFLSRRAAVQICNSTPVKIGMRSLSTFRKEWKSKILRGKKTADTETRRDTHTHRSRYRIYFASEKINPKNYLKYASQLTEKLIVLKVVFA